MGYFNSPFSLYPARAESRDSLNVSHATKKDTAVVGNSNDSDQKSSSDDSLGFSIDNSIIIAQVIPDFSGVRAESFSGDVNLNYGPEFFGVDNSCALSFSQGCRKEAYFSIQYIGIGPNLLPFSSDDYQNKEIYKLFNENSDDIIEVGENAKISIESDYEIIDSSQFNGGASIAFGYDFGGFRGELLSTYTSFTQKLSVDGGFVRYTVSGGDVSGSSPRVPVGESFVSYTNTKPNDLEINIETYSFLLRSFIDIPTGSRFSSFFGIGLGAKYIDVGSGATEGWDICSQVNRNINTTQFDPCPAKFKIDGGSKTVFVGQAIAGVSFSLTKNLSLNSEVIYDYASPGEAGDYKFSSNGYFAGSLGLRYKF